MSDSLGEERALYATEIFADDWGTYWVAVVDAPEHERSPEEAVALVAKAAGPFEDSITVERVYGVVGRSGDGEIQFRKSDDGTFACWEVEAS